jgi:hypothetical protein
MNPNKEVISMGREPTPRGRDKPLGGESVNMTYRRMQTDSLNIHEPSETKAYPMPPMANTCGRTRDRISLPNEEIADRINPALLDAFRANPYTHPLNAAA